ncbi:MAG: hypothetical protein ACJ0FL_03000 [Gammaproteobacteria bacterium]|jgi:hypothetical protein|tara:strand:- start:1190 stop:1474 length:285 start_codon:yes stop_codon:yes gene_type:complete
MKNLIIFCLFIFTAISCTSTSSNKVSATDLSDEQIAKYNEGKEEDNQIVCRNEKPLGSNIAERVCYTVAQLKAREKSDKEDFRRDNNIFEPAGG